MYAAVALGQSLAFEVAGFFRRNMLMRDRQTGSIWQQATGTAVAGPLRGQQLEPLAGVQARWAAWRSEYPQTTLAEEPPHAQRGLVRFLPLTAGLDWFERQTFALPGLAASDRRLPSRAEVAGLRIAGEARAYSLALLRRLRVVDDVLGGVPIALVYDPRGDRVRAFERPRPAATATAATLRADDHGLGDAESTRCWDALGRPLPGTTAAPLLPLPVFRQWWMAWSELHPGTSVYQAPG